MTRRRAESAAPKPLEARESIPTTELLRRLEDHALGKVEMSSTEVRAAEILLKKRLPDLSTMAMAARPKGMEETLEEMLEAIGADGARKA